MDRSPEYSSLTPVPSSAHPRPSPQPIRAVPSNRDPSPDPSAGAKGTAHPSVFTFNNKKPSQAPAPLSLCMSQALRHSAILHPPTPYLSRPPVKHCSPYPSAGRRIQHTLPLPQHDPLWVTQALRHSATLHHLIPTHFNQHALKHLSPNPARGRRVQHPPPQLKRCSLCVT